MPAGKLFMVPRGPSKNQQQDKKIARLESITRPEIKYKSIDSGAFDTIGSTVGTLIRPMELMAGTTRDSRIGDKVKTKRIRFQGIVKMPANPTNATCGIRFLILRCKKSGLTTSDMPTWYGGVDEEKFFIIKDKLTNVSAMQARTVSGTSYATGSSICKLNASVSTSLRKLQYDGTTNQSPLNNEYLIYLLAENQSAEIAYNWQHYFIDN